MTLETITAILGSGTVVTILSFLRSKRAAIWYRKLTKGLGLLKKSGEIIDEQVRNELNTISDTYIDLLKHHTMVDTIKNFSHYTIPIIYMGSHQKIPQSLFAYCSVILMETYLEMYLLQLERVKKHKTITKQSAELEIMQQLKRTIIVAMENMEAVNIPKEVIFRFLEWYNIEVSVLYETMQANLQIATTYKEALTCTLYTCNYFVRSFASMVELRINTFNGEITKIVPEEVYASINFKYPIFKCVSQTVSTT